MLVRDIIEFVHDLRGYVSEKLRLPLSKKSLFEIKYSSFQKQELAHCIIPHILSVFEEAYSSRIRHNVHPQGMQKYDL